MLTAYDNMVSCDMSRFALINNLESLYAEHDNTWVKSNSLVLNYARQADLAIGGSVAMSISNKRAHKTPSDLDFFTDNKEDSTEFVHNITAWLDRRVNTHYKLLVNHETKFTLPNVSHHVRIIVPFWKPICVMTIKSSLRSFFYHGLRVQYFDDVVAAAKQATEIDGKDRVPHISVASVSVQKVQTLSDMFDIEFDIDFGDEYSDTVPSPCIS